MEGTVISDAVNVAARLQSLTKTYGTPLLTSAETMQRMEHPECLQYRLLDRIQVKGRRAMADLYEIFETDPPEVAAAKRASRDTLASAVEAFHMGHAAGAIELLDQCRHLAPGDGVLSLLAARWRSMQLSEMNPGIPGRPIEPNPAPT